MDPADELGQVLASQGSDSRVVASVTGSAHYGSSAIWTTYSFRAVKRANGEVEGSYQVRRHRGRDGGAKQHGRIICLTIQGNQAWLGAIRENTAAVTNEGTWTGFSVVDNGEGKRGNPDQIISLVRNTDGQEPPEAFAMAYCENQELVAGQVLHDIEAGNIQVRD